MAQSFDGRHQVYGPFWQGRYWSKLVEEGDYLQQLIHYIHHNPVAAGLAEDPTSRTEGRIEECYSAVVKSAARARVRRRTGRRR